MYRLFKLRFASDLCNTFPWMTTSVPGISLKRDVPAEHSSILNSSSAGSFNSPPISMNPVPESCRTNRFVMGDVLCDPGTNDKHPFVVVQSSKANQKPTADGGSVYKNTES